MLLKLKRKIMEKLFKRKKNNINEYLFPDEEY